MALFVPRSSKKVLQDLQAKVLSRTKLSDINIGSTLHILLNAIATEIANTESRLFEIREGFSLSNATGEELDQRCSELPPIGISRKKNIAASGSVLKITRSSNVDLNNPLVIPAGSTVSRSSNGVQYRTTQDAVIAAAATTVDNVPVVASRPGDDGNCLEGEIDTVVNMPASVISVTNTSPIGNGLNKESDASLRQRALRYVNSIGRVSKSSLEYLGTTYKSSDNSSFTFAKVYEDPTIPGYSELVVDDGTGLRNVESLLQETAVYTVPAGGARFLTHQRPATRDFTTDNIIVTRNNARVNLREDEFVSLPERGLVYFKPGVLLEDDTVQFTGFRVYNGLIPQLQEQIEGNINNGSVQTGFRAAGTRVRVVPPTITDFEVDIRIIVQPQQDREVVQLSVKNAAVDYINSLDIGKEVTSSTLTTHLMVTQPLASCSIYIKGTNTLFEALYPNSAKHVLRTDSSKISVTTSL